MSTIDNTSPNQRDVYRKVTDATTAIFRVQDQLGRERWVEQSIDLPVTGGNITGPEFEDDLEELLRR